MGAVAAVLLLSLVAIGAITLQGLGTPAFRRELWLRLGTWCVLPLMIAPEPSGRVPTIIAVRLLSLLCYREFARATGLFREHVVSATVVLAILLVNFAALDHWYGFFVALGPLSACVIAVSSIPLDRPSGYVQRTGLALPGFMLFGLGLAHPGSMANDPNYRPIVLLRWCWAAACAAIARGWRMRWPPARCASAAPPARRSAPKRWARPSPGRVRIGPPLSLAALSHDAKGWAQVATTSEAVVRALG